MKRLSLATIPAFTASQVMAHGGGHLHPHGFETGITMGAVLVLLAGFAYLKTR